MASKLVSLRLNHKLLLEIDNFIKSSDFGNRTEVIKASLRDFMDRYKARTFTLLKEASGKSREEAIQLSNEEEPEIKDHSMHKKLYGL